MGINSLSMSASDLPRIKSVIRTITREQALSLLNDVLHIERAAVIRELLTDVLVKAGLGGLVRAGA
jgi:phosphotransferase system enzyme I (PtsI)/phosphotransferase system enzyme I (PtsP)